jgi:cytochrome b subunit of formate dehydrogenase
VPVVRKSLYWLAVLVISLALVAGLILLLESRDRASLGSGARPAPVSHA